MIYGYIRVSTEKQTVEVQRYEINRYCRENGIEVDAWNRREHLRGYKT